MALLLKLIRTCSILMCLFFNISAIDNSVLKPRIISITLDHKICDKESCKYLLNIKGGKFLGHYSWKLTAEGAVEGSNCGVSYPNYELKEIMTTEWTTKLEIILPVSDAKLYFCLYKNGANNTPFGGKWVHQGSEHFLDTKNAVIANLSENPNSTKSDNKDWDLTHDTDINYLQDHPNLSDDEINDIEVLYKNNYVPLKNLKNNPQFYIDNIEKSENSGNRLKRNVSEHKTVTLRPISKAFKPVYSSNGVDLAVESVDLIQDGIEKEIPENTSGIGNDKNVFKDSKKKFPEKIQASSKINTKSNNYEISEFNYKDRFKRYVLENISTVTEPSEVSSIASETTNDGLNANRRIRQVTPEMEVYFDSVRGDPSGMVVRIEGIRVEESDKEPKIIEDGIPSVLADSSITLRVFGTGITSRTVIAFTHEVQDYGQPCKFLLKGEYMVKEGSLRPRTALYDIVAPSPIPDAKLYICAKNLKLGVDDPFKDEEKYLHQGTESFKTIATHNTLLPLWVSLILILTCLTFSALFSGLNLGLMSLDRTELKIISNTGTEQERKYARAIMPVRDHGNYLLCSILLGNVAVNSTFTILLDELTSGLFAVIVSTLAIVLLGEITPQAICSRHGLMVGAKSIMVTKAVMALTAPMAFPVSKLLDYFLGEEIGSVYNRERLKELVKVTTDVNDLDKDEVNIISGALELRKKTVSHVMTKLEDVFMLPISAVLDFETMSEIIKTGYSRVPVYEGSRTNILTVLFIKDLAFVDPDDNTPLRTLCQYYQNPCNFVFEDVTLDVMFKQFKDGHKGHMAFVHRINNEGEGDPFYETIGLVTLEDVIEEMIQAEIVDETDVFLDNRSKRRRNKPQHKLQDFAAFAERHENQRIHISPQLTLATFQFLSTSVDAFRPDTVSETVLRRLLRQDVIHHIKLKGKTKKDPSTYVFQQGKPVDYFVLILEGRVEVTVGRENLVFEAGPFTYFGVQALTQNVGVAESPTPSAMGSLQNINMDAMLRHTFVPDYSVRAIAELFYLTVKRSLYLAAKRATLMEKGALSKGATNEQFDTEVDKHLYNSNNIPISLISKKLLARSTSTASTRIPEDFGSTSYDYKLLQSVDEDISISGEHKTPSRQVSPNPPVSASPHTRSSFSRIERNGDMYRADEQEKLLK